MLGLGITTENPGFAVVLPPLLPDTEQEITSLKSGRSDDGIPTSNSAPGLPLDNPLEPLAPPRAIAQIPDRPEPPPELVPLPPPTNPQDLLEVPDPVLPPIELSPSDDTVTVVVERFDVVGSTVFSAEELAAVLAPFTNRPLTLSELLQARTAVTQLYLDAGYITSGAYIPPQVPDQGVVTIQVIEGSVDAIEITGNRRLNSAYVRDRLELVTDLPLNAPRLIEGLRLLQLDLLIDNVTSELSAGLQPGSSILTVDIVEADTFHVDLITDNNRVPSIGSWERGLEINQANLLGLGDGLSVTYLNTDGSNEVDASYTLPLNPRNGTLNFSAGFTDSHVIEEPFDALDIDSESNYFEVTYRQPIWQTPAEEFALSLTGSFQESRSLFLEEVLGDPIPFPTLGADADGRIRVSALRFAQEWTQQGRREVLALRSQFNVGLDLFNSTIHEDAPDSRFFSWQGQGQWVRLLAPDTLLLLRTQAQLSGDDLVPQEQIGLGGQYTVRGYRQDLLLTDNAVLATAELRLPVYRNRSIDGLLQVAPFLDVGTSWNAEEGTPDPNTLVGLGLGLLWQQGDRLNIRLDWGIPLTDIDSDGSTWQESGFYFSIRYRAF